MVLSADMHKQYMLHCMGRDGEGGGVKRGEE